MKNRENFSKNFCSSNYFKNYLHEKKIEERIFIEKKMLILADI